MAGNSQVENLHFTENHPLSFGPPEAPISGTFSGHLNLDLGEQFHAVGQGHATTTEPFNAAGFNLPAGTYDVNFVINDHTQNVVAHTKEGVVHFNNHAAGFDLFT